MQENDQMVVSVTPPRAEIEEPEIVPEGEEGDASQADGSSEDQDSSGDEGHQKKQNLTIKHYNTCA